MTVTGRSKCTCMASNRSQSPATSGACSIFASLGGLPWPHTRNSESSLRLVKVLPSPVIAASPSSATVPVARTMSPTFAVLTAFVVKNRPSLVPGSPSRSSRSSCTNNPPRLLIGANVTIACTVTTRPSKLLCASSPWISLIRVAPAPQPVNGIAGLAATAGTLTVGST